jgi:hypothetical protein
MKKQINFPLALAILGALLMLAAALFALAPQIIRRWIEIRDAWHEAQTAQASQRATRDYLLVVEMADRANQLNESRRAIADNEKWIAKLRAQKVLQ